MQPNGCILVQLLQLLARKSTRPDSAPPESVLQIKRAGPEIDDPMMGPKNLGPE